MLKFITKLFATRPHTTRTRPTTRLRCEGLEDRSCPSITFTDKGTVNPWPANGDDVANASSANGSKVVVWGAYDGDSDIYAQRYDAAGAKVGGRITVTANDYYDINPDVAMDADGGFVVTWRFLQPVSGGQDWNQGVRAARYSATGELKGTLTVAGGVTPADRAMEPSVAVAADGDFVVAYTRLRSAWPALGTPECDVYYRAYHANGIAKQEATAVAAAQGLDELNPAVASAADGRFAIAYESESESLGNPAQVRLRQYTAALAPVQAAGLVVNQAPDKSYQPDLAMGDDGRCLVVWRTEDSAETGGLRGRRVSATGSLLGEELDLGVGSNPQVAIHPTRYQAVVTFESGGRLYAREVDSSGDFLPAVDLGISTSPGAVSVDGSGEFLITFDSGTDITFRLGQMIPPPDGRPLSRF